MDLKKHLAELAYYLQENGVGVDPIPKVKLRGDSQDTFGPTAYFDPADTTIVLYVGGRHPKDILRSFAHEMIHADQHAKGKLKPSAVEGADDSNYAQNDSHLRKMEQEAYLRGNMLFRDWTDTRKKQV